MEKENIFEQFGSDVKEIEKAEIFNALKNYGNPVMIKKTGKEIKDQLQNILLPILEEKLIEKKEKVSNFLSNVAILPQGSCYCRLNLGEEFPYKVYTWEETHYKEKSLGNIFKSFGEIEDCCDCECCENDEISISSQSCCTSKEDALQRTEYNCWVEDIRDLILDIRTANVLINNLSDTQEYYLNLDQLLALKF